MKTRVIYIDSKTGDRIEQPENYESIALSVMYNPEEQMREIYLIVKIKN